LFRLLRAFPATRRLTLGAGRAVASLFRENLQDPARNPVTVPSALSRDP
jgi:hypothetical protein